MESISKAIIAVMTEVNGVAKSMTVWKWSNAYQWVSDKDVKTLMRESMIKNWLSILPISVTPKFQIDRWEEDDTYNQEPPYPKKTKQSVFTEVETKYLLLHTSWESIELAWYGHGVDTQDKWAGKATTYALKNTLLNMFLVPTGVDTDDTHSDDLTIPKKTWTSSYQKPQNSTWANQLAWFNKPQLEACIKADNAYSMKAIESWALDNWYKLSWPSRTMIEKYLTSWEL